MRVFITGANRGLGLEMARQCLKRGDRVWAACRQPETASELNALKQECGQQLSILELDVTDLAQIEAAAAAVAAETDGLDLLINNAGYYPHGERPDNLQAETMLKTYRTNCVGPMMLTKALLDLLKNGQRPRVVNLSSYLGSLSHRHGGGTYSYSSSKAALNMLTRALAFDLKPQGILAAAISPGWVRTDMGGAGAPLSPEQSVGGFLQTIDELTPDKAGRYWQWNGEELPW